MIVSAFRRTLAVLLATLVILFTGQAIAGDLLPGKEIRRGYSKSKTVVYAGDCVNGSCGMQTEKSATKTVESSCASGSCSTTTAAVRTTDGYKGKSVKRVLFRGRSCSRGDVSNQQLS